MISQSVSGLSCGCVAGPRLPFERRPCRLPSVPLRPKKLAQAARPEIRRRSTSLNKGDQELKAAEQRWENQVRDGKVRNVSAAEAGKLMKEGWYLLDVRPTNEVAKVAVESALAVPLFLPDPDMSPAGLLKKASAFGMGGWWLGGSHMIPNAQFMAEVQAQVPKEAGVIVACQKGLRSLAACEQLSRAGYSQLAWINGGFDTARGGDLATSNGKDLRYAGIGGLSEVVGWTEVQQQEKEKGVPLLVKIGAVVLVADLLLFAYEQISYMLAQSGK